MMITNPLTAVLILTATALFVGCGGSPVRSTTAVVEPTASPVGASSHNVLAQVREDGLIRIGVKTDSAPFGFMIGDAYAGFDVDIATAVAARIGVENVEFVPVTSADRIDAVIAGQVDLVAASMTITRSRELDVDFSSVPYFSDGQGLLVRSDSPIQSYIDLGGMLVGAVEGTTSADTLGQVAPGATILRFATYSELEAALSAGTIDAVTSDTMILLGMKKRGQNLRLAGSPFTVEPYGIALPENQSDLRDAVSDALQNLWESGEYQLIYSTWFGPGTPYHGFVSFQMDVFPH